MRLKCRYAKTKSKYKLESGIICFKLFPFSAKVGFDSELNNSDFLQEIGLFNIENVFNPYLEFKNCLQFQGSQFEKWRHNFSGGCFESILSTKQFLNIPGDFDLQNDSK